MEYDIEEMLRINEAQKIYYETTEGPQTGSFISKYWAKLRDRYHAAAADFGIYNNLYELHWKWMGSISDASILDLGCHQGNPISISIAQQSKSYLGIDLSESAIEILGRKLEGVAQAQVEATDFLSQRFQEQYKGKFNIIYAHSVAHHFKHFDLFLNCLANCLAPNGMVITYDPMQTSYSSRITRYLYRPFQPDKHWEFPFDKSSFQTIQANFDIEQIQGLFGKAKWAIPLYMLKPNLGKSLGKRLHAIDIEQSNSLSASFWHSLHVTMLWRLPNKD